MLTLVGTVCVCLVTVVPTIVVPITRPVLGDASAAVALELGTGAGMTAAGFIAVVPTVIVWAREEGKSRGWGQQSSLSVTPSFAPSLPPTAHPTPTEKITDRKDKQKLHRLQHAPWPTGWGKQWVGSKRPFLQS